MWTYNNELYHHGIKGQKWGVRRYQNYDGTYTKRGLERYNLANDKYRDAVSKYESAKAEKRNVKTAKADLAKAKKKLDMDYRADRGKELYGSGKTIKDIKKKQKIKNAVSLGVLWPLAGTLGNIFDGNIKFSSSKTRALAIAGLAATGGAAWTAGLASSIKSGREIAQLRAYYDHRQDGGGE